MTPENNESATPKRSWFPFLNDLAWVLLIVGVIGGLLLLITTFGISTPIIELKCVVPNNPIEMIFGVAGMMVLTAIGLPLVPSVVFGAAIWAIVKFALCHQ